MWLCLPPWTSGGSSSETANFEKISSLELEISRSVVNYCEFMFESISAPPRPSWKLRIALATTIIALAAALASLWRMTQMPLRSYRAALPPLTASQAALASRLQQHVQYLSVNIGERSIPAAGSLEAAADYIRQNLIAAGYSVIEQRYQVDGHNVSNLEAEVVGNVPAESIVVVGAHYDSVAGTVGANDNATGVAAALELARMLQGSRPRRSIRFVFFVNEEPPYFQTEQMGSLIYAHKLRRDKIPVAAMISLETLGYYSDSAGSQKYPAGLGLFYPDRGNFVGFVSNTESRDLVRRAVRQFRKSAQFPSEGIAAPESWPGIGWSDQWSFWQEGCPAIMITDTAVFRYPYYHTVSDTEEKVDFQKLARVVEGVKSVISAFDEDR